MFDTIEDGLTTKNISFSYEIKNQGPSNIDAAEVFVFIPLMIWMPRLETNVTIIDLSAISIEVIFLSFFLYIKSK